MAIGSNSKRFQLIFNKDKDKEKIILDYLSQSFNENNEIKRILYEYIVSQSPTKRGRKPKSNAETITNTNLKSKSVTGARSQSKVAIESNSDKKLLTITESKQQIVKGSNSDSYIVKDTNNDTRVVKDTANDDFTLDISNFGDDVVEVNKNNNSDSEEELIRQNELEELKKFI